MDVTYAIINVYVTERIDVIKRHNNIISTKSTKISSLFPNEVIAMLKGLKNTRTQGNTDNTNRLVD